jgi:hemoglobin-like flavoprotein
MTEESLNRIHRSFVLLSTRMDRITRAFYARLFEARPDVRPLFQDNLDAQRQHLAAAVALIVRNVHMLDALEVALAELGAGHSAVGVRPEHYPPVRDAMLSSISDALSPAGEWTNELANDWGRLIDRVSTLMLRGGRAPQHDPNENVNEEGSDRGVQHKSRRI